MSQRLRLRAQAVRIGASAVETRSAAVEARSAGAEDPRLSRRDSEPQWLRIRAQAVRLGVSAAEHRGSAAELSRQPEGPAWCQRTDRQASNFDQHNRTARRCDSLSVIGQGRGSRGDDVSPAQRCLQRFRQLGAGMRRTRGDAGRCCDSGAYTLGQGSPAHPRPTRPSFPGAGAETAHALTGALFLRQGCWGTCRLELVGVCRPQKGGSS